MESGEIVETRGSTYDNDGSESELMEGKELGGVEEFVSRFWEFRAGEQWDLFEL